MNLLAVHRKGPAKFTVRDFFFAFDLIRKAAVVLCHKQHVSALFALGRFHFPGFSVRQQEELPLCGEDHKELALVPAGVGSNDV
jgi:hypothetical protein